MDNAEPASQPDLSPHVQQISLAQNQSPLHVHQPTRSCEGLSVCSRSHSDGREVTPWIGRSKVLPGQKGKFTHQVLFKLFENILHLFNV